MRREYNKSVHPEPTPIPDGCIFYAPLDFGDLSDHVSGSVGLVGNGQFSWNETMQAYMIKTTTGGQKCLKFNIQNRFNLSPNYNYSYYAELYVESFTGTCDFLSLGSGTSDRYNAVSLAETHRWNSFTTGKWNKMALTKSGSNITFYMNGAVNKTSTTSTYAALNASSWLSWGDCKSVFVIGGGYSSYKYVAYIRNIMFFDRVLTSSEIQGL